MGRGMERIMKDKKKRIVKRLAAVTLSLIIVLSQIGGTAPWNSGFAVRGAEVCLLYTSDAADE